LWDRLLSNALVLILLIILLFFVSPRQDVIQLHSPDDFAQRPEHIWVWDEHWASSASIQIERGRAVVWSFGWGSSHRDHLEELLDGLEMEFYIDERRISNPERYFALRDFTQRGDRYWTLVFRYEHPPLSPGEYTWHIRIGGTVRSREIGGILIVSP